MTFSTSADLAINDDGIVSLVIGIGTPDDGFDPIVQRLGHVERGAANNVPDALMHEFVVMKADWYQGISNRRADEAEAANVYAAGLGSRF